MPSAKTASPDETLNVPPAKDAAKDSGREGGQDFIREIVAADLKSGKYKTVVTRFPPEPNGYLHIGHAKSICLNFGIAEEFGGRCHLRFDDTNPIKEEQEYIDSIMEDVHWLGFDWGEHLHYASDYFDQLYAWAELLIKQGKAYVDDQSPEEMRASRGTLTEPGKNSPWRDRSVEENLDLFRRMRTGEFPNGARVLRAKIDMASGNINFRDPVLYRILHARHPRTGDTWCIYPSYDYAHGQSDAIEHVTHSVCTLEFADHRPLYDWFIDNLPVPSKPHQYEFARLNLAYTVLSKRVLTQLVGGGHVSGWDDPRMPTIAGLRRRGVPPEAAREFARRVGVAKAGSTVEYGMFEFCVREHLNKTALRRMAVLRPLKVVIENYPEGQLEELDAINNPEDVSAGTRKIRFSRELWIERDDFMENPPKKFFRLSPGKEVRLRYGYFITCREVVKDANGEVVELRCTYDPQTRGGSAPDGRKVQATLHWVSAADAVDAEVRLYDQLFAKPDPDAANFAADLNPNSLDVLTGCKVEPALAADTAGAAVQFERQGYFYRDHESTPGRLVFNRTVGLRDTWAKVSKT
ncbi:MAG TPA: glutamine--tRNA ligase/YqeY domain fusion protein [Hyphomicrobiaceae bacterium]|nr:glutamine--tRNA ligase/YqeY domain fusion protein [Hyphomicrobiaceae bacterium]